METVERPVQATEDTAQHDRRPLTIVLVAIIALLLGGLGGWLIRGSDDGGTDDAIEVVTGELTDRQQEMLRVADEHYAAFVAGDGEALTALYVPQGVMGDVRADDGTMAAAFEGLAPPGRMEMLPPALVFEDNMVRVINWGSTYGIVGHLFTTSGDVLIIGTQFTATSP